MTETMRRCSICSTEQPLHLFSRRADHPHLYQSGCNPCRSRRYREGYTPRAREHKRDYKLRAKYGITTEQYVDLLAAQGGRCAICKSDDPGGRWNRFMVDHCHETGTVRGLLCHRCNVILGMMGDTANGVEAYVRYFTEAGR